MSNRLTEARGRRTVLVTGSTGTLGPWLADAAAVLGVVVRTSRSGGDLCADLRSPEAVAELIEKVQPSVVFHAAAATNVDDCETHPEHADVLNHRAVAHLCAALAEDTHLVLVSTDQVYPDTTGPHIEGSEGPVNVYGSTKLAGERAAIEGHKRTAVIRTNLFGPSRTASRPTLSDTLAERLRNDEPCPLFTDVLFSPLHLATLSEHLVEIGHSGLTGTFNLGCRGGASKHDFAVMMANHLGLSLESAFATTSDDVPNRARRTHDLRLDVHRIEKTLGIVMPSLEEQVRLL